MFCRSHDPSLFVGNVVLQAGSRVNGQLNTLVDRTTKSAIILGRIKVICVVLGVVDMIFGTIAPKSISRDFEFLCAKSKCHETKNPEEDTNGLGRNVFDGTDIDCLSWKRGILAIVLMDIVV